MDFVSNQDEKNQKRLTSEGAKGAEDPFVPFAPLVNSEYPEIFAHTGPNDLEDPDVPGNEIFEERVAAMMYDGGLSEAEAIQYLIANPPHAGLTAE